jgi:hypothetical protein
MISKVAKFIKKQKVERELPGTGRVGKRKLWLSGYKLQIYKTKMFCRSDL